MLTLDSNLLIEDYAEGILKNQESITWEKLKNRMKRNKLRKDIETSLKGKGYYIAIAWGKSFIKVSIV